jgi:hypothetical protein
MANHTQMGSCSFNNKGSKKTPPSVAGLKMATYGEQRVRAAQVKAYTRHQRPQAEPAGNANRSVIRPQHNKVPASVAYLVEYRSVTADEGVWVPPVPPRTPFATPCARRASIRTLRAVALRIRDGLTAFDKILPLIRN